MFQKDIRQNTRAIHAVYQDERTSLQREFKQIKSSGIEK